MILSFFDVTSYFEDEDDGIRTYEVCCPKCNCKNLIDIDYSNEIIDSYNVVDITIKCNDCNNIFCESEVNLEIVNY